MPLTIFADISTGPQSCLYENFRFNHEETFHPPSMVQAYQNSDSSTENPFCIQCQCNVSFACLHAPSCMLHAQCMVAPWEARLCIAKKLFFLFWKMILTLKLLSSCRMARWFVMTFLLCALLSLVTKQKRNFQKEPAAKSARVSCLSSLFLSSGSQRFTQQCFYPGHGCQHQTI